MRVRTWLTTAALGIVATASPVSARVVRMETSVTLADRSRPSVEQALRQALDSSVQGALAMGLVWMCVDRAVVLSDVVVLRAVGSDEELQEQAAAKLGSASCRRFSDARQ